MADFNSSLPIRTETNGDVVSKLVDFTTNTQGLAIDAAGLVGSKLFDGAGTAVTSQVNGAQQALDVGINVAGVQVDPRQIRALTSSDSVTAVQGNAAATHASPWWTRLTDGTNDSVLLATGELTVSVTQPLPAGTNLIGSVNSRTEDGAGTAITSTLINSKQRLDINSASDGAAGSAVPFQTTQVGGSDGTNLRALSTDTSGKLKIDLFDATGAAFSTSNPLPVQIAIPAPPGTHVNDYKDASDIAAAASDNHDYTVTALKTLTLGGVVASASGKAKMLVQVETGVATGVFTTLFAQFNSTADTNMAVSLTDPINVAAGVRVRVVMTNLDKAAQDLYSTICGTEN